MKKRILLGMSGGVDSSASAILLKEQGYEVIGLTMKLWEKEVSESGDTLVNPYIDDAKNVCNILGIEHYTADFSNEFKKCVIHNFIDVYNQAKTPNPCIECNKYIKFKLMYEKAKELGAEYIATGHYAKTEYSNEYSRYVIKRADSEKKDQSYVLYNISKDLVEKVIFPLGKFKEKSEIRKIVQKYDLKIAEKPESQEICFIPDNDYAKFILNRTNRRPMPGNIVNTKGEILGKHQGLIHYTIGQRKGLRNIISRAIVCNKTG